MYFLSFIVICTFVMLNLFILVILEQFDQYYLAKDNPINIYKRDVEVFKKVWTELEPTHAGLKLPEKKLTTFFSKLDPPLGMKGHKKMAIVKHIVEMELMR